MEINKYWTNKGYSSGFGDLINQISYDYTNTTEPTTINWCLQPRTNRQVKRVLNFFKPNDLITHQFKNFTQTDEPPIGQHPHDYWPAKLLHKGGDYIAIWLYTKHKSKSTHHQDKVADRTLIEMMIRAFKANGYKVVIVPSLGPNETIYNIEYDFDQYGYMLSDFLRNCKFLICSEGGIAHLARLMRVPTLVYFNQTQSWKGHEFDLNDFWTTKYSRPIHKLTATVAQLSEQLICNQQVGGSSPLGSSTGH